MIAFLVIAMSIFAFWNSIRLLRLQGMTFMEIRRFNESQTKTIDVGNEIWIPETK